MDNIQYKTCKKCNDTKTIDLFGTNGNYIRSTCKSCLNVYSVERNKANPEKRKESKLKNKQNILQSNRNNYYNNREIRLLKKREYYQNNKQQIIDNVKAYRKDKLENNSLFKFIDSTRTLIRNSFKRRYTSKAAKTIEILGCDFDTFKIYIEQQFDRYMHWDNYGTYWVLDHIKPVGLAITYDDVLQLNHYTNFQPLEKIENLQKSMKYL